MHDFMTGYCSEKRTTRGSGFAKRLPQLIDGAFRKKVETDAAKANLEFEFASRGINSFGPSQVGPLWREEPIEIMRVVTYVL